MPKVSKESSRIDVLLKQKKSRPGGLTKRRTISDTSRILTPEISPLPTDTRTKVIVEVVQKNTVDKLSEGPPSLLEKALAHLRQADNRFDLLSKQFTPTPWTEDEIHKPQNHFQSLVLSVISQQVSGAAARAITKRFIGLFKNVESDDNVKIEIELDPEHLGNSIKRSAPASASVPAAAFFPTAVEVSLTDVLVLKSAGLSLRKAEYVHGISQAFVDGYLNESFFAISDDAAIIERLVSLRGIGPWSAEMFLMFSLKRPDILSTGDIGIQRGMSWWVGKNPQDKTTHNKGIYKYMTDAEMRALSQAWKPYRSIGCWYMWRVDGAVDKVATDNTLLRDATFCEGQSGLDRISDFELVPN